MMQEWDFAWEVAAEAVGMPVEELIAKNTGNNAVRAGRQGIFRFMQRMGVPQTAIASWSGRDCSAVFHTLRRVENQGLTSQAREVVLALSSEYRRRKLGTQEDRKQAKRIAEALQAQKRRAEDRAAAKREADAARPRVKMRAAGHDPHIPLVVDDGQASIFWAGGCTIRRHPQTGAILWSQNNKHLARYMR